MTLAQAILAEFQAEAPITDGVLAAVPEDKFDFQPHAKSMTLGQLASHVAEGPAFVAAIMEPEIDLSAMGEEWKPFIATSKAELLAKKAEVDQGVAAALDGRDDAYLSETWTMRKGDQVVWQAPRHVVLKSMAISHTIHHRGQLQVYLRLLDIPVPPVYGPTADVQV